MEQRFKIEWIDRGYEPQCAPNPHYPEGIDIDGSNGLLPACLITLPYPARRCGYYYVECGICQINALITTAGRPDDPRSIKLPCALKQ